MPTDDLYCMLFKIKSNLMHPLNCSEPLSYIQQDLRAPLLISIWDDLDDSVFYDVGLADFKSRVNAFLLTYSAISF